MIRVKGSVVTSYSCSSCCSIRHVWSQTIDFPIIACIKKPKERTQIQVEERKYCAGVAFSRYHTFKYTIQLHRQAWKPWDRKETIHQFWGFCNSHSIKLTPLHRKLDDMFVTVKVCIHGFQVFQLPILRWKAIPKLISLHIPVIPKHHHSLPEDKFTRWRF